MQTRLVRRFYPAHRFYFVHCRTRVGTGLTTSTDTMKNKILSVYLYRLVQKISPCQNFVLFNR